MAFLIVLTVIEGVLAVLVAPVPVAVAAYFSLDRERAYAAVSVLGVRAALLGVRPRGGAFERGAFELTVNGTPTESGKPAFSERARSFAASAASKCRVTRARVSAAVCLGDAARSAVFCGAVSAACAALPFGVERNILLRDSCGVTAEVYFELTLTPLSVILAAVESARRRGKDATRKTVEPPKRGNPLPDIPAGR